MLLIHESNCATFKDFIYKETYQIEVIMYCAVRHNFLCIGKLFDSGFQEYNFINILTRC